MFTELDQYISSFMGENIALDYFAMQELLMKTQPRFAIHTKK